MPTSNDLSATVPNPNRVSKKQWVKWSARARRTFNETYRFIYDNQDLMTDPKMARVAPDHWKTISWNAAWITAAAAQVAAAQAAKAATAPAAKK